MRFVFICFAFPYIPSSIPCGPRLGPSWAKLGPKWAPDGPDWGPFGNAAWDGLKGVLAYRKILLESAPKPFCISMGHMRWSGRLARKVTFYGQLFQTAFIRNCALFLIVYEELWQFCYSLT